MLSNCLSLAAFLAFVASATAKFKTCRARDLPAIEVFGLEITDLHAKEQRSYEDWGFWPGLNPQVPVRPIDFCNITVTYTHPGQGDTINVYVWLPLDNNWNGRFLGQGGGGWVAGPEPVLAPGVSVGYATAITDAGHTNFGDDAQRVETWGFLSPGNVNWVLLQDFASRAIDDLPKIAKQVIKGFYGEPQKYSYWNGCSTGGRQGLMSAQRFPTDYDGIISIAPAINWATFVPAEQWAQIQMQKAGYFPPACELEAIHKAAIASCDELDGVRDGVVAAAGLCNFDATTVIGQTYDCERDNRKITPEAAKIANSIWDGPKRADGTRGWFGMTHEAPFGSAIPFSGLAGSTCDENNRNCKGIPFIMTESWIRYFIAKDPDYDIMNMTEEDFWQALHQSRVEYTSIIDTADPDLSDFKAAGGKIIMWHGLADQLIPPNGTANYFERVLALDPEAADYFRYFEAPGVGHCMGGPGAFPSSTLDEIIRWVEEGVAPETLDAETVSFDGTQPIKKRILCPYPQVAAYVGGDVNEASSYQCADSFDVTKRHVEL